MRDLIGALDAAKVEGVREKLRQGSMILAIKEARDQFGFHLHKCMDLAGFLQQEEKRIDGLADGEEK